MFIKTWLVGGIPTPLKNMKVSWDDDIPNIWKAIKSMFQSTNQMGIQSRFLLDIGTRKIDMPWDFWSSIGISSVSPCSIQSRLSSQCHQEKWWTYMDMPFYGHEHQWSMIFNMIKSCASLFLEISPTKRDFSDWTNKHRDTTNINVTTYQQGHIRWLWPFIVHDCLANNGRWKVTPNKHPPFHPCPYVYLDLNFWGEDMGIEPTTIGLQHGDVFPGATWRVCRTSWN